MQKSKFTEAQILKVHKMEEEGKKVSNSLAFQKIIFKISHA